MESHSSHNTAGADGTDTTERSVGRGKTHKGSIKCSGGGGSMRIGMKTVRWCGYLWRGILQLELVNDEVIVKAIRSTARWNFPSAASPPALVDHACVIERLDELPEQHVAPLTALGEHPDIAQTGAVQGAGVCCAAAGMRPFGQCCNVRESCEDLLWHPAAIDLQVLHH